MYVCQPISEEWPTLGFWAGWFDDATGLPTGGPDEAEPRCVVARAYPSGTWLIDRQGESEPETQCCPWRT